MSESFQVTEHPVSAALRRSAEVLTDEKNMVQLIALLITVVGVWLASIVPFVGWMMFLVYCFAAPYAGAFLLEVSHYVYSGRTHLPPYPGKGDLLGIITPGLAHTCLLLGLFVDVFPMMSLLIAWGAVLGFLAVPLNHSVNGGSFPGNWDDWGAWLLGCGLCSALGVVIVVGYDFAEGLGPLRTMIPLLGGLVLTIFSAALSREGAV